MDRKVLIVSDSHGNNEYLQRAVSNMRGMHDRLIHLGDCCCDPAIIEKMAGCPVDMVRGNCDSYIYDLPETKLIDIEGYRILLLHGHRVSGMAMEESLWYLARENDAQIVMFGHTHIPVNIKKDGIWLVNPGSISRPRQDGHQKSYLVMNIEKRNVDFVPVYLEH